LVFGYNIKSIVWMLINLIEGIEETSEYRFVFGVHTMALRNEHLLSLLSTLESSCTRTDRRPPSPLVSGPHNLIFLSLSAREAEGRRGMTI
jgi:hypothetical protein